MYILGIETSCDETAAAIVKDGREILSNVVVSQIDIFKEYGGVIPEVAARSHLEAILPVIHEAIRQAEKNDPKFSARNQANLEKVPSYEGIDAIAVTHTPGLLGSLLIGTLTARTIAILHDKPLYPVHHLKSHIYANWLSGSQPEFPLLALVVSGGHTQIIRMTKHNEFEIIGTTRDDAVGECFDKVAKILGLPYPGGPSISKAAQNGDPQKYKFPHPKLSSPLRASIKTSAPKKSECVPSPSLDFSFSGLKTAVLREVQKAVGKPISFPSHELKNLLSKQQVADFAASFENTATDILVENLKKALALYPDTKSICLAGGVSANKLLREKVARLFFSLAAFFPLPSLTGDNAAMVATAAFYEIESGVPPTDPYKVSLAPRSPIDQSNKPQ